MDDVASAHSENLNLRKIQQKLLQWEKKECSLSQLTQCQIDIIEQLNESGQQKAINSTSKLVSDKYQQLVKSNKKYLIHINFSLSNHWKMKEL